MDGIGIIGLGAMGAAYARRLLDRGMPVLGFDPDPAARDRHKRAGGAIAATERHVVERCDVVITSVPTFEAFDAVNAAFATIPRERGWVIDTNTVPRDRKIAAHDQLAAIGWQMLDCAVSGNPAMVLDDSYSFFLSGEQEAKTRVRPVIDGLASRVFDLGDFGNASTIKLIVNHLLMIHNAAAAEAMSLGVKAGLDRQAIYDVVTQSGGSSRMFEIRGRMMAKGDFPKANTFSILLDKDGVSIGDLARRLRHPVPMFAAAYNAHMIGLAQGWDAFDASAMMAVYEGLSGQRAPVPATR